MRIQKQKMPTERQYEMLFYKLWRDWLLETKEEDWQKGDYVEEYKQILSMPFQEWWDKNKRRVANIGYSEYAFIPINSVEDFNEYAGERIFMVGFSTPKHILHEELEKLIDQFHKNHEAGHDSDYLGGIRSMAWNRKPTKRTVDTVGLILKVYKQTQKMERKNSEVRLYEIGKELKLRNRVSERIKKENAILHGHNEKELMSITVSRYLRWAGEIKAQLTVGEFPYYNQKPFKPAT